MGEIAWSATRVRTFQECGRKYYYRYHLAPLARKPDPPSEALLADRVKDLVGLEAWAGDLVHGMIEQVLNRWRAGRQVTEDEVIAGAVKRLRIQYRDSHAYWSAHPDEYPTRPVLLDMHYYGEEAVLSKDRAAAIKERVIVCLQSFLRSRLAARIRAAGRESWRPIDRNAAARIEGNLLVLVKPDFAFREGDDLHIIDWKTGKADPFWEMVQVTCYALYAEQKWGYSLDRIIPQIVHLYPEFRTAETEYNADSIQDVLGFIRDSQGEIRTLIGTDEVPPAERFAFTSECRRCGWCQFRGLCDGALRGDGEGDGQRDGRE